MSILVPVALFGWIPVILLLFTLMPARRAVIVAFIGAWLFLPMAGYPIPGLPDYTKITATTYGVLIGVGIFDVARLLSFRPRLVDLPMAVWCVCPLFSSLDNGLGLYDGVSAMVWQTVIWGLPYLIGRIYFNDLASLRELAIGIFIGGLIYVPLCLFEIRMSPQLHTWVYGYHQHSFGQTKRFGGWRPTVFMQHGLAVGMWMTTATIVGLWLWMNRLLHPIWGITAGWWLLLLLVTTILCKSLGAIALLIMGVAALLASRLLRTSLPIWCLIAMSPLYIALRGPGAWDGMQLHELSLQIAGEDRAGSLMTRLQNEDILAAKAMEQPVFGWGGWGRNRVFDERGRDVSITDGLWIIALGKHGWVGLGAMTLALLLPAGWLLAKHRRTWLAPAFAPAAVLALLPVLWMIDNILNGMINPIFILAAGGVLGLGFRPAEACVTAHLAQAKANSAHRRIASRAARHPA